MKKLVFIVVALFFITGVKADEHEGTVVKVGDLVPDFKVVTLAGETFDISQLRGKVVLINFFATWCGPCMKELPVLESKVWKRYSSSNFAMISIGRGHTTKQLVSFNAKKGFTFPIAQDPQKKEYSKFATKYIPRNILVDKNGEIIYHGVGFDEDELEKMLKLIENNL